ncbi:MAG: ABC transporter permease [Anaerolineae bacterium]|nr:ABC transporter permease [Thermoflexus sp.]MDW8064781.1 ABC transporter permease [Anaerolineae bacterium]
MQGLRDALHQLRYYPSALLGLVIIGLLVLVSIYTVITMPYSQAIELWRAGEQTWRALPRTAPPAWLNWFRREKLPETIALDSRRGQAARAEKPTQEGKQITLLYVFEYRADDFPSEINLFYDATYPSKPPFVSILWRTPDHREILIGEFSARPSGSFRFDQDEALARRIRRLIGDLPVSVGLFTVPNSQGAPVPLKGSYQVEVRVLGFEPQTTFDAELVVYGKVHGLAGTDHLRRDLRIALLWGAPVALTFGLLAAVGTIFMTVTIAAIGAWFGGLWDDLIQRANDVVMMLPFLPILIMIGTLYSRSIWVILGVSILLSVFGTAMKTFRAIFIQVRSSPYIEAARAYGAGSWRIIFRYLIPPVLPVVIPNLIILVPSFVFLEASLAVLGLGDPVLPTWGKVIENAVANGAPYRGQYYWVLEPAFLLMITGLGFAMLGFALDRIFNPRLREM